MINFKNFLESFDKPYKFEVSNVTKTDKQYGFETDDGIYYIVSMLMNTDEDKKYIILTFETEQGAMYMTDTGDAFRVMATVIDIMKKESSFLKSADVVHFDADPSDKGRVKLYKRLAKILKKTLGFSKVEIELDKKWHEYVYSIIK